MSIKLYKKLKNNLHLIITIMINLVIIFYKSKERKKGFFYVFWFYVYGSILITWWHLFRNVHCDYAAS